MDNELVEAMARGWCEGNGHTFDLCPFAPKHRESARRVLAAVREAGFDVYRPDDCETVKAAVFNPEADQEHSLLGSILAQTIGVSGVTYRLVPVVVSDAS